MFLRHYGNAEAVHEIYGGQAQKLLVIQPPEECKQTIQVSRRHSFSKTIKVRGMYGRFRQSALAATVGS